MSVCVKTAEVSIFLLLLPFKQQPDGLWEALWPWIVLPVSGVCEWRMVCVLPLRGISSWRQGRGDPLRHTTTHRDTEVSLDSPSSSSSAQPPPHCFPFPGLDAHHLLVNSLSLASYLNGSGFFLPPLHPPSCSTVVHWAVRLVSMGSAGSQTWTSPTWQHSRQED